MDAALAGDAGRADTESHQIVLFVLVKLMKSFCQFQHRRNTDASAYQKCLFSSLQGKPIAQRSQDINGIACREPGKLLRAFPRNAVHQPQLSLFLINAAQTDGTRKNPGPVF